MADRFQLSSMRGCLNPLCPHANWSNPHLPRWWVRAEDGQIHEFAACDAECARAAGRLLQDRLGSAEYCTADIHALLVH